MLAWKTDFVLNVNELQDTETQVPPALNELHQQRSNDCGVYAASAHM